MITPGKKVAATAATFFAVLALISTGLAALPGEAFAQVAQPDSTAVAGQVHVDSIDVVGNARVTRDVVLATMAIPQGADTNFREVQRGIKALFGTGQFDDVRVLAREMDGEKVLLVVEVEERPLIRRIQILGLDHIGQKSVTDTTKLKGGEPYSPSKVRKAEDFIRSQLATKGIPFARIEERLQPVDGMQNVSDLVLNVTEGQRVTIADVRVEGNEKISQDEIVAAMTMKPEGFLWFRPGTYDDEQFRQDLAQAIPDLYRSRGYLDFRVVHDTLVIDPETGKARAELLVDEGAQYHIGNFTVEGNREFTTERIQEYFQTEEGGLLRSLGFGERQEAQGMTGRVFDAVAFDAASAAVQRAYANEGYLYVRIEPVVLPREPVEGEVPTVDISWQIQEGIPAHVKTVSVVGNDYTFDWVVRDKIFILPGDRYSLDRVIQSYQSIASLGFFETPLPEPNIQPDPETGDVDITFRVKEKQTGSVNFGTSVGGGVGLSGFLGYDQPNLFGQAKEGHLRWDFGRYLNSFTLTYSDPAIQGSQVSGSSSLFNSRDRFIQFANGSRKRMGIDFRFGFPVPGALRTRVFAGYSISRTKYQQFQDAEDTSLFGRQPGLQSLASLGITRTTVNHPIFPTAGSRQNLQGEFNGGILGGDADFTKITADGAWWVPVGQVGGGLPGSRPVRFTFGLTVRTGAIFGDAGAFPFDQFWMGGVQFGQQLRGYDETSVTPLGFFPENNPGIRDIDRLGNAFLSLTAEYAMRVSDNISLSTFFDAGNTWRHPSEVDPTKLFRGAGFGAQLVTPFGPIGLDYAYGFDKTTPGWQFHFRMGPGF